VKPFVLDGSAALALVLPDERGTAASRKLREALGAKIPAHVPAHWWVEVTNGILMAERRKRITLAVALEVLGLIPALEVSTDREAEKRTTSEVAALAREKSLTAYDAAYLELAIRLGAVLATQDQDLRKAAVESGVEVLG
jgi:predicted nucleic acid-binding protein